MGQQRQQMGALGPRLLLVSLLLLLGGGRGQEAASAGSGEVGGDGNSSGSSSSSSKAIPSEGQIVYLWDEFGLAKCLDGSPPAYYFRPGYGSGSRKWLLFYEGGGWCGSTDECYYRSMTSRGSSASYNASMALEDGMLSPDPDSNPLLYNWNVVFVKYCDGGFWTGNRRDTDVYRGKTIYYRGRFINAALIRELRGNRGMRNATDVVVAGCSAGGVQTLVNLDHLASYLPPGTRVLGLPDSGYLFPYRGPGQCDYEPHMASTFALMNASWAVPPQCLEQFQACGEAWRCLFFGQYVLPYVRTPLFVLNSRYDSWQTDNLYCSKEEAGGEATLVSRINDFGRQFEASFWATFARAAGRGHGYVLYSCDKHCWGWTSVSTDDGRTQSRAFQDWYDGPQHASSTLPPPPPGQGPEKSGGRGAGGGGGAGKEAATSGAGAAAGLVSDVMAGLAGSGNNTGSYPCQQCCANGHGSVTSEKGQQQQQRQQEPHEAAAGGGRARHHKRRSKGGGLRR